MSLLRPPMFVRVLALWKESYDKPRHLIKKQSHHFANKGLYSQSYGFSSSHVQMWVGPWRRLRPEELMLLNCGVEDSSPLDCKEIKPINPKGKQLWILIGSTVAEAEAPKLWSLETKSRLIGKDLGAGKDWRQKEKRVTEDGMVGWHHWLNCHELGQTPGDGKGQGSLASCSPWGRKESDTTWRLNYDKWHARLSRWC